MRPEIHGDAAGRFLRGEETAGQPAPGATFPRQCAVVGDADAQVCDLPERATAQGLPQSPRVTGVEPGQGDDEGDARALGLGGYLLCLPQRRGYHLLGEDVLAGPRGRRDNPAVRGGRGGYDDAVYVLAR